jgi:hypothetical protein
MKRALKIAAGLLALVLLLYVALGCLIYFYYEPQIKLEMKRQDGWNMAIAEIEDECRRLGSFQSKDLAAQKRQRDRLQQEVNDEKVRRSQLERGIWGRSNRWSTEWMLRTEARLEQAQQALAEFDGPKKDPAVEAKIESLHKQLAALRVRRDRLHLLIEWRDRLKIWPLPVIDRFAAEEEAPGEK